jgi:hypothetical protein
LRIARADMISDTSHRTIGLRTARLAHELIVQDLTIVKLGHSWPKRTITSARQAGGSLNPRRLPSISTRAEEQRTLRNRKPRH